MSSTIQIDTKLQTLIFYDEKKYSKNKFFTKSFLISSSINGIGQIEGSFTTPIGKHRIYQKIGDNAPIGAIFKGRKFTGTIYHFAEDFLKYQQQNLILTRIIWLIGEEDGFNLGMGKGEYQGKNVDSKGRYIYIHGTNHEEKIGTAASRGCIQMKTDDLIWLFNQINTGDKVWIR